MLHVEFQIPECIMSLAVETHVSGKPSHCFVHPEGLAEAA